MASALKQAAIIQVRVIGALMLRDLVAEGNRGSIPFVRVFLRPVLIISGFYLLGRAADQFTPQGFPLLVFIVTGYLTWIAFFRCFSAATFSGTSTVLMFPHLTELDLFISTMALQAFIYTVVFGVFCALGAIFEQAAPPAEPLGLILAFWSAMALGMSAGLIAGCFNRFTSLLHELWQGVRLVGHALSGVFLLATDTPEPLLQVMRWNPLFHCVEWMRESWWPAYKSPIADPYYVLKWILFMTAIGLAFERSTRRWRSE